MNFYIDSLLAESGHTSINELLETMDLREANAYRDDLQQRLEEVEKLEQEFFEAHGKSLYMDRLKMPFEEETFEADIGVNVRPLPEGDERMKVPKEYSTDTHTQQMLKIDDKIKSELGVSDAQLEEGLDLGLREPLSAQQQEEMQLAQTDEDAGPLYSVRHNIELIENKMLRKIQNHLADAKY